MVRRFISATQTDSLQFDPALTLSFTGIFTHNSPLPHSQLYFTDHIQYFRVAEQAGMFIFFRHFRLSSFNLFFSPPHFIYRLIFFVSHFTVFCEDITAISERNRP
jgi:hypothetical protein